MKRWMEEWQVKEYARRGSTLGWIIMVMMVVMILLMSALAMSSSHISGISGITAGDRFR